MKNEVYATTKFLEHFFSNLLMGTKYELKNRYMHVEYVNAGEDVRTQSATDKVLKCKNCTLERTFEEVAILKHLMKQPNLTQKELALRLGKSERTVKDRILRLQEKDCIRRVNGKRYGMWEILVEIEE